MTAQPAVGARPPPIHDAGHAIALHPARNCAKVILTLTQDQKPK